MSYLVIDKSSSVAHHFISMRTSYGSMQDRLLPPKDNSHNPFDDYDDVQLTPDNNKKKYYPSKANEGLWKPSLLIRISRLTYLRVLYYAVTVMIQLATGFENRWFWKN